ncbi:sensor histidine kinase [Streptomyces poonensis]|uniref:Sensor-like histidine kinase SenX3 n=1 Tax=Streptomyces poonensis TaxID=68255 RepID=A0A918PF03_9ACTN|nr:HAMP domain-containing sensor histidine kinase [Streptomyces poonensis]GGZ03989.1 two-component sensor histidine kinase [Streptomyces poonensis]GLJ90801.1 two-component sensor histidine kinase [Streptomyces poonensis]
MVHRARLRIAVLTGVIITLLVVIVGSTASMVMTRAQNEQVWRELRYGAARGDLSSPPGCTWLYAPGVTAPRNGPAGFPVRADLDQVRRTHDAVERTVRRDDTVYLVRTQARADGHVVQAVFDMRYQLADRTHLWYALGVAEAVGLLAAAVTGVVLGRLSVAPLAEALGRQRRFVTDASHELRTPVTQVYTRVQVLSRQAAAADLPAPHRDGLARLVGSVGRLGEVLDDLLLSASLTAGPARRAEHRPVDLVALARSVVAEESDRTRDGRLTVAVDGPPHPLFVDGVESALRRAVGELLSNAIGHTPPGGRIEVALVRVGGGRVELTVTDTGPGFETAEAERLFDRFHRGGDGGRYGLGLALLREVVTHHGGTVAATGRPGHGARFTIRLPEHGPPPTAHAARRPVRTGHGC